MSPSDMQIKSHLRENFEKKKRVHLELVGGDLLKLTHLQGSQVCFVNFTGTDFFYSSHGFSDTLLVLAIC